MKRVIGDIHCWQVHSQTARKNLRIRHALSKESGSEHKRKGKGAVYVLESGGIRREADSLEGTGLRAVEEV